MADLFPQYANAEQIKKAQEQAYGLLDPNKQPPINHWTGGLAHMLNALQGRMQLDSTVGQQKRLDQQEGQAGARVLGLPQEALPQQNQIPGYVGPPPPPLPRVPSEQEMQDYLVKAKAAGMSNEAIQKYIETIQERGKPISHPVPGGELIGNPLNGRWQFQPQEKEFKQGDIGLVRQGQGAIQAIVPGITPTGQTVKKEEVKASNTKETAIAVPSLEFAQHLKSGTWIKTPTGRVVQIP